jgi:hypothetical protein
VRAEAHVIVILVRCLTKAAAFGVSVILLVEVVIGGQPSVKKFDDSEAGGNWETV